jgi:hypothetical protein
VRNRSIQASLILSLSLLAISAQCSQNPYYVAQSSAGSANGASCSNAYSVTTFNTAGNWGSGSTQIGPGTVVHFCGTITSPLTIQGSGTSGNVITFLWETGARVSVSSGQIINLNGSKAYLLFDGGIACGPNTACALLEKSNLTGYADGQAGIIEATANGSGLTNQSVNTQAFYGCNGCHDIEIKNLIIRNLYIHSNTSDLTSSADTGTFTFQCSGSNSGCAAGSVSIHDSTIHDNGNAISLQKTSGGVVFGVYNVEFYRNNWAMEYSGSGSRTLNFYNNHCSDTTNWDTSNNMFHHNCLHAYMDSAGDSIETNFYNNLADGDWGTCCTTTTLLFDEVSNPNNFNVFNNLCLQYSGNMAPCMQYGATSGVFANNTALGVTPTSNVSAFQLYGTNIRFDNNAVSGYGQFVVVNAGTTFTSLNYNRWGTTQGSGNSPWQWGATGANTFASWKTACACDANGSNGSLGVDVEGRPQSGSALIGTGENLSGLSITALNSDLVGTARGATWDIGAYQYIPPPTGSTSGGPRKGGGPKTKK